jgi:amidase
MGHIVGPEGILQGITQPGPMARRVEDLALGLGIMAGPDWRDPYVVPMPVGDPAKVVLRGLKVAVFTDNGVITPRADLMEAVRRSAAVLRSAGAVVSEARPDGLKLATDSAFTLMTADGGATLIRVLDRVGTGPGDSDLRTAVAAVTPMSSGDFTALLERLDQARMTMLRFLERFDAIVCPVNADVAVKHGTAAERIYPGLSYTVPFNVAGWPAGVVRAATSSEGLPIGVQVVAGPWREDVVLALLAQLERELGGWQPAPGL